MKKSAILFLGLITYCSLTAQRLHIGLFGGFAAYNGDLTEGFFPQKVTNGVAGVTVSYEITDQLIIKPGISYAVVGGSDKFSKKADLKIRNLSFETAVTEFSLLGEYYFLNLYERKISPYVFAGLAVFHFNPYSYYGGTQKVFLKPLSTEGQGLTGYPDRKPYNLTQPAIPVGIGVKFAINDNLRIGLEGGLRKLFTDYLDDVSTNYADATDIFNAKGQIALDMSYRSDEAGGSLTYPAKGSLRGSPKNDDYYYFTGLHLTYRLGAGNTLRGSKVKMGCPANVY